MDDARFTSCFKGIFFGGFLAGSLLIVLKLVFRSNLGVLDVIVGATAGAVVGLIPAVFLPSGFSLPKDITTLFYQGCAAYCLWVVGDGLARGKFVNFPQKSYLRKVDPPVRWSEEPIFFLLLILVSGVIGSFFAGAPVFYFLKAIRDTSAFNSAPLPGEKTLLPTYRKWKELPENFQAISS